jgi:hypothetical protein
MKDDKRVEMLQTVSLIALMSVSVSLFFLATHESRFHAVGGSAIGPVGSVGSFVSPRTKQVVWVMPKKGESANRANQRVRKNHGVRT